MRSAVISAVLCLVPCASAQMQAPPLPPRYELLAREAGVRAGNVPFVQYAIDTRVPFMQVLMRPGGNLSWDYCDFQNATHYEVVNGKSCTQTISTCQPTLATNFDRLHDATYFAPCDPSKDPPSAPVNYTRSDKMWYYSETTSKLYGEYFCVGTYNDGSNYWSTLELVILADDFANPQLRLEVSKFTVDPPTTVFDPPAACV